MGLQPGLYSLRLAASPSPLVGVELIGPGPQPVLTRGRENLWRVVQPNPDEEKYLLFIEADGGRFPLNVQNQEREIVGNREPPETIWRITGPEGGPYEIHVDTMMRPSRVWTVEDPSADLTPVVLNFLLLPMAPENQKWYFVLPESE